MDILTHGVFPLVDGAHGLSKLSPEGSTLRAFEAWEGKLGDSASISDKNFFRLFRECGAELRYLPVALPPSAPNSETAVKEVVIYRRCHDVAFGFAEAMHSEVEGLTVWFGFVDDYEPDKGYVGTLCHSFLSAPSENGGKHTIVDPLQMRLAIEKESGCVANHCGVPMPYGFLKKSHKRARSLNLPWVRHFFHRILSNDRFTDDLISAIKKEHSFS